MTFCIIYDYVTMTCDSLWYHTTSNLKCKNKKIKINKVLMLQLKTQNIKLTKKPYIILI